MAQETATLEIIAPSVEEAVAKGLSQLGMPEDAVDVEILDEGSRGFLGLGTRQARVRLRIKEIGGGILKEVQPRVTRPRGNLTVGAGVTESRPPEKHEFLDEVDADFERDLKIAEQVVGELLEKMRVHARVKAIIVPPQDENDQNLVMVEVQGNDLSILIGRRSETLNALQYISSLIISKEAGHWVPLLIDVQGYRARRERQLRVLARRMAEQVVQTGKRIALEPMPANERRIIHLELRNHPEVTTESFGEEPNRKVTIIPRSHL